MAALTVRLARTCGSRVLRTWPGVCAAPAPLLATWGGQRFKTQGPVHMFVDFTSDELQEWFSVNGFEKYKPLLKEFSGKEFFALTKEDLKEICGTAGGLRLYHARNMQHSSMEEVDEAEQVREKEGFLIDMDGVIYHRNRLLPGVQKFVSWLKMAKKRFIFFTNSSDKSPTDLQAKLRSLGIDVEPSHFYSSALATAHFVSSQKPYGSAYVIGENGLVEALNNVGYTLTDVNPDYVILGETKNFDMRRIEKAVRLVQRGARLVGTNLDIYDKVGDHNIPGVGSLIQPIKLCTGTEPYFCGKPNPLMMRTALRRLRLGASHVVIIGDRMDTDILAGLEAGMDTVLVLSGVSTQDSVTRFSYRPTYVFQNVASIVDDIDLDLYEQQQLRLQQELQE